MAAALTAEARERTFTEEEEEGQIQREDRHFMVVAAEVVALVEVVHLSLQVLAARLVWLAPSPAAAEDLLPLARLVNAK